MRSDGVPSWPVVSGDRIAVGSAVAFLKLADQNRVEFDAGSQASLRVLNDGRSYVHLQSGGARFTTDRATLLVCDGNVLLVPQAASAGSVQLQTNGIPGLQITQGSVAKHRSGSCGDNGPVAGSHAVGVVTAAATAAGVGAVAGVLAHPGPTSPVSVSPSQP